MSCLTIRACGCGAPLEPGRARCKPCHAAYMRGWRLTQKTDPKKNRARSQADYHKAAGNLPPQPCIVCGSSHAQMHHPDYDKPLEVVWLCKRDHLAWHTYWRRIINNLFDIWVADRRTKVEVERAA